MPAQNFCRVALVAVLLCCAGVSLAGAQTAALRGTITDAETGQVLPNANIAVQAGAFKTGTSSSLQGFFEIAALAAGTYLVKVSYVGYENSIISSIALVAGQTQVLDIALIPATLKLNPIVVSPSRRPERIIESPAAISSIERNDIASRPALTPTEHLRGLPGVNVASTGINSTRMVVRGFNEVFSTRLLTLVDHRIVNLPGLRLNLAQLIPTTNQDVERIEVLKGPGSALYGPNAAGGVLHVISRSPFDATGTQISVGLGERDIRTSSLRHAGVLGERLGYKVSARYQRGTDWKFFDPAEPDSIKKVLPTSTGPIDKSAKILNERDFDVEAFSGDARLDYRWANGLQTTLTGGFSQTSNIELAPTGSVQTKDWALGYLQGRLLYGDLFAQVFLNKSDAGDSFNLRTGELLVDESTQFITQVQHGLQLLDERQRFTYGVDVLLTRPNSANTIYGRNEDDDDIDEVGLYIQSETDLTPQLKVIGAARIDDQNHLSDSVFSPRAALVFKPDPMHNFRLTYNRAFQTPLPTQLFLDINVVPSLAPGLDYAVRARGVLPGTSFKFRRDASGGIGGLYMQSPFTPTELGGRSAFLPADATLMWNVVVGFMQLQGVDLSEVPAPTPEQVGTALVSLNTNTKAFEPTSADDVFDLPPLEARKTIAYEAGYKGVIDDKLLITTNLYYEKNRNFARLGMRTPNVVFEDSSLAAYLGNFMSEAEAAGLAQAIAGLPLGTISPEGGDPADMLVSLFNFGEVSYSGAEFGLVYYMDQNWVFDGNYTYLSKNLFEKEVDEPEDLSLNAPKHRVGARASYKKPAWGLQTQVRLRYGSLI